MPTLSRLMPVSEPAPLWLALERNCAQSQPATSSAATASSVSTLAPPDRRDRLTPVPLRSFHVTERGDHLRFVTLRRAYEVTRAGCQCLICVIRDAPSPFPRVSQRARLDRPRDRDDHEDRSRP